MTLCTSYCNRPRQWSNTLDSLLFWYGQESTNWLRLSIQDDSSDDPKVCRDITARYPWKHTIEYVDRTDRQIRNPGILFNRAVELAEDGLICLTNPECLHMGDVLAVGRREVQAGSYTIFGCRPGRQIAVTFPAYLEQPLAFVDGLVFGGWYQHSSHRNCLLHFCSMLWKADYQKLGGFDPVYDDGSGYEDNDFAEKVLASGMKMVCCDRPYVLHQWHARPERTEALVAAEKVNADIFKAKWGFEPRRFVKARKEPVSA